MYVLDNLRREVQGAARMRNFETIYFINLLGWGHV
jgi:hypothetical protein